MWQNRNNITIKNVKKIYSDFFTNEIREIESERQCFAVCRSSDEHEQGVQIAHAHGFCAAFQPLKGSVFAPERHVFAQKDGPREKKALTFFHGDIPFWKRGCSRKIEIWAKPLPINEIANPSHFRVFFSKSSCREFWAILSHVEPCFSVTFVKTFYLCFVCLFQHRILRIIRIISYLWLLRRHVRSEMQRKLLFSSAFHSLIE